LTKSQEILIINLKEFLRKQIVEALKNNVKEIKIIIPNSESESDVIDVESELKRWRNSKGCYSLNPDRSISG
jgi:hypothetical protein